MIDDFLNHIPDAASSPLAFVAYGLVVAAWVIRTWLLTNPRRNAQRILAQFTADEQRRIALAEVFNEQPPTGLKGNDAILTWVKIKSHERTQTLFVVAWLATAVAVLLFLVAVYNYTYSAKAPAPIRPKTRWLSHFDDPKYEPLIVSWDGPAQVVSGDLVVPAGRVEYFKNSQFPPLSNFTAHFEFRLAANQKSVGWVVRANKAKQSYYQFTVNLEVEPLRIDGEIVRGGRPQGTLNCSSGDRLLPFPRFDGEVLTVDLEATDCNFVHKFRIRTPTEEQARVLDAKVLKVLVGNESQITAKDFEKIFSAGMSCEASGQFGFLSPDSELRILTVMVANYTESQNTVTGNAVHAP